MPLTKQRALVVWTSLKSDVAPIDDQKERQAADDHMGLMTPVIKGMLTDVGFAEAVAAQQMFGGHGYICRNRCRAVCARCAHCHDR